jgi:hypothetical protein
VGGRRRLKASWLASRGVLAFRLVNSAVSKTRNYIVMIKTSVCNNETLRGEFLLLIMLYLWTRLRVSFSAYISILVAI